MFQSAGGRDQLHPGVFVPDIARSRPGVRQAPVHHVVHHHNGGREFRGRGVGGHRGQKTAVDPVRSRHGRNHVDFLDLLLLDPHRRKRVAVRVGALRVPRDVCRPIRHRGRLHACGAPERNVPSEHPFSLFGHRFHNAGDMFVCHQQNVPARIPSVRIPRDVLSLYDRQFYRCHLLVHVRLRDQRQDARGNPGSPGKKREKRQRRRSKQ